MNENCVGCVDLEEQVEWYDTALEEAHGHLKARDFEIIALKADIDALIEAGERFHAILQLCYGKKGHDTLTVKTILSAGVDFGNQIARR